jgi:hypothetical protein
MRRVLDRVQSDVKMQPGMPPMDLFQAVDYVVRRESGTQDEQ